MKVLADVGRPLRPLCSCSLKLLVADLFEVSAHQTVVKVMFCLQPKVAPRVERSSASAVGEARFKFGFRRVHAA